VLEYFDAVKIGLTATPALHDRHLRDPIFTIHIGKPSLIAA
jgi:type I site-specific restriction endonuclease